MLNFSCKKPSQNNTTNPYGMKTVFSKEQPEPLPEFSNFKSELCTQVKFWFRLLCLYDSNGRIMFWHFGEMLYGLFPGFASFPFSLLSQILRLGYFPLFGEEESSFSDVLSLHILVGMTSQLSFFP